MLIDETPAVKRNTHIGLGSSPKDGRGDDVNVIVSDRWVGVAEAGAFAERSDPPMRSVPIEPGAVVSNRDCSVTAFAMAKSMVGAVRATRGITAGLLPLPMIRSVQVAAVKAEIINVRVTCFADP